MPIMQKNRDEDVAPTMIACWLINSIFALAVLVFPPRQGSAECNPQGTQQRIVAYQNGRRIRCINWGLSRKSLGLGKWRRLGILARTRRS